MRRIRKKIRALWLRRRLDRDLEDELRFHLEMKAEESGGSLEARRRFGNPAAWKESCRDMWTFVTLETWWRDIRYALRTLGRNPGFTVVAVIALALAIGADTAIFTIVNGALSWNLGLDRIDRVVVINATDATHSQQFGASYPDFLDFRARTKTLAGLAAYSLVPANLSDGSGLPERYWLVQMSANGFSAAGMKPLRGRDFTPTDERPGAPPVRSTFDWRRAPGNTHAGYGSIRQRQSSRNPVARWSKLAVASLAAKALHSLVEPLMHLVQLAALVGV